jgi:hypothetical protein
MSSHKQPQIGHVTELITVIFIAQIPSLKVLPYLGPAFQGLVQLQPEFP